MKEGDRNRKIIGKNRYKQKKKKEREKKEEWHWSLNKTFVVSTLEL